MKTRTKRKKRAKDRYLELVQYVPLRPIRNEGELDEAINMVDYLVDQRDRRSWTQDEKDYIDVLSNLIEQYEEEHYPFESPSPSAMLQHLIEAKGVTQAQAAKDCRIAASTISELLAGTRKMNRNHIAKFAAYFHVGPGVFFEES
jgi:HTH-type transcriptional regulator/antitoxin HigA